MPEFVGYTVLELWQETEGYMGDLEGEASVDEGVAEVIGPLVVVICLLRLS